MHFDIQTASLIGLLTSCVSVMVVQARVLEGPDSRAVQSLGAGVIGLEERVNRKIFRVPGCFGGALVEPFSKLLGFISESLL